MGTIYFLGFNWHPVFQRVRKSVYLMAIYINNVTRMDDMFWVARSFNHDINDWNTAQVTNRLSEPTASPQKKQGPLGHPQVFVAIRIER